MVCPPLCLDWSGAAGTVSRDSSEPLTAFHIFRTASNTKTYVAAAILRLVEMNRLKLDDSVGSYLPPQWRQWLADDGYNLPSITLRMILSHIIELETGLPLGPAVRSLLDFEALGLRATWWEVMEEKPTTAGPLAHQYFSDFETSEWNPSLDLYGGGGLMTDARDLGLFTRKLIKGDVLKSEAMLMEMTGSGTSDYRLGLFCYDLDGRLGWGHTGFWNTFVVHVPTLDLTISGCVLNHHAVRGMDLVLEVVDLVDARNN